MCFPIRRPLLPLCPLSLLLPQVALIVIAILVVAAGVGYLVFTRRDSGKPSSSSTTTTTTTASGGEEVSPAPMQELVTPAPAEVDPEAGQGGQAVQMTSF